MESAPVVLPIELNANQVRPVAYRVVSKKHGLNLKSSALDVLAKFLGHHFGSDWRGPDAEKFLDDICRKWKEEDRGIFVDGEPLQVGIKDWNNADASTSKSSRFNFNEYFKIVNAQDCQKLVYNAQKKNFLLSTNSKHELSAIQLFTQRYHILLDKLYRNELFQPAGLGSGDGYTIVSIKNMLGKELGTDFFLFGLLEQQFGGPWFLHDISGNIQLQITKGTQFAPGNYYCSGSFVLCYGTYQGETFLVGTMGPPQPETRAASQEAYDHIDFYNSNSSRIERIDPGLMEVLKQEESKRENDKLVILGADIFLDEQSTLDSMRRCLYSLEESPPTALILPGSFISLSYQPYRPNIAQVYRDAMNALAEILTQCPKICASTKIVLLPGPNDPWHSCAKSTFPYFALPEIFTGRVERAARDVNFATNPTRLLYLSQEFVFFRSDMGDILRRYSIPSMQNEHVSDENPAESSSAIDVDSVVDETTPAIRDLDLDREEELEAEKQVASTLIESNTTSINFDTKKSSLNDTQEARRVLATLLDQSHLLPLTLKAQPVLVEYNHVLSMAQWPSALILCDPTTPAIKQQYEDCAAMNPGRFILNGKANWMEYSPASGDYVFKSI